MIGCALPRWYNSNIFSNNFSNNFSNHQIIGYGILILLYGILILLEHLRVSMYLVYSVIGMQPLLEE